MRILLLVIIFGVSVNISALEPTVSKQESIILAQAALLEKDATKQAVDLLQKKISNTSSAAMDYALAVYLIKLKKLKLAENRFKSALVKLPEFTRARLSLVRMYIEKFDYNSSIIHLNVLLDQKGKSQSKIWNLLGYCHQNMKNSVAAEQAYKMVIVRDANNLKAYRGLVQVLIDQVKFKEAKVIVDKLLVNDPQSSELWNLLAVIALEEGDQQQALVKLLTAEQLGVKEKSSEVTVASLFFQNGFYRQSAERYVSISNRGALSSEKTLEAISAFLSIDNFIVAEKLLSSKPVYSKVQMKRHQFLYCRLLIGKQRFAEARKLLKGYLAGSPIHVDALVLYGDLLKQYGDLAEAILMFTRAERLDPTNQKTYLGLTQCFIDKEDYVQAELVLQRLLDYKDNESIRKFKNNLKHFIEASKGQQ